jgi:hypothetical protein
MDEDLFKYDDFMGKFSIYVKDLKPGKELDTWFKLYPRKWNEKVSGDIHLQITFDSFEQKRDGQKKTKLKDILNDSFSLQYFQDFLVKECRFVSFHFLNLSEENLLFYQTIEDFKKKVQSYGSILVDKDYTSIYESALGIYETFIKPNANFEVNVEYNIKTEYINKFEKEVLTQEEKKMFANVKLFDNIQIRTISIMELGFPK